MKFLWVIVLAVLGVAGLTTPVAAQSLMANVVATCGTPNSTPSAGGSYPLTIDTSGKLCDLGGGSGTQNVKQVLPVATDGITPYISAALESCHVMKASQAAVISYGVTTGATAGYLMVFNATSAPADGAVTPAALAIQVPANATVTRTYSPPSTLQLSTGFTVCFSSTGPFTKTASSTAMLEGTWQ